MSYALAAIAVVAVAAIVVALAVRPRHKAVREVEEAPLASSVSNALRLIAKLEVAGTSRSNVVGRLFDARGKSADDFRRGFVLFTEDAADFDACRRNEEQQNNQNHQKSFFNFIFRHW